MPDHGFSSITEQVARVLREGLRQGRWRGTVPGRIRLAAELGVNHKTVQAALRLLEQEGLLAPQGNGRVRRIVDPGSPEPARLRVMILLYERSDKKRDYLVDLLHRLQESGHEAAFAPRTMRDLGMDAGRIARFAEATEAGAWVVVAGPREVLEWFSRQQTPAFALFGRASSVPLASTAPRRSEVYREVVDRLVTLGHRRVVLLVRNDRRKPSPGWEEQLILEELRARGIRTGPYNLPDWDDSPAGLKRLIDSLFRHTPPTALLIDEAALLVAVRDHLSRKGILAPDHVSLVCCDPDPVFDWCRPPVSHIDWDPRPLIRRVVKWAGNVSRGKDDRRRSHSKARFVPGGTIGRVGGKAGSR